jgi:alpha-tubulin suppressor-like RCC1 family protein
VDGGWDHYCAVTTDGDIYCWGWNHKGQLGAGTDRPQSHRLLKTVYPYD